MTISRNPEEPKEPKLPKPIPGAGQALRRHLKQRETKRRIADKIGEDVPIEEAALVYRRRVLGKLPPVPRYLSLEEDAMIEALAPSDRFMIKDPEKRKTILERERYERRKRALKYDRLIFVVWTHRLCRDAGCPLVDPRFGLPQLPADPKRRPSTHRKLEQVRQAHELMYQVRRFLFGADAVYIASARLIANELVPLSPATVARYTRRLIDIGVIEYAVDEETGEVQTYHGYPLLRPGKPIRLSVSRHEEIQRAVAPKQPEPATPTIMIRRAEPVYKETVAQEFARIDREYRRSKGGGIKLAQPKAPTTDTRDKIRRVVKEDGTVEWWKGDRLLR